MNRLTVLVLLFGCGCALPGRDIRPEKGDFAFIEIQLKG